MNKKQLHHFWTKVRPFNPWYFLILSLISGVICVNALRQNNLTMIKLKTAVSEADKKNADVETALRDLREFVYGHMNTNLSSGPNAIKPPIQLTYRYDRLVQAEADRVKAVNSALYVDAEKACEAQIPIGFSGGVRVGCVGEYVSSHGITARKIPSGLYKFDFVSPAWSPDLAGWSMLAAIISFALFVALFGLDRWLKAELRD